MRMFKPIKKVHIYCSDLDETLSFSPADQSIQFPTKFPTVDKAFDLAERYNQLMAEFARFYEESDHIYFE